MLIDTPPPVRFDTIEHTNELFDHLAIHNVEPRLTRFIFPALALGFHPQAGFERGLPAKLAPHLENDGQLGLFMEHKHELEPFIIAAATFRTALDSLRHGTNILAKPVLFDHWLRGWLLLKAGGTLVMRPQDGDNPRFELPPEGSEERAIIKALVRRRSLEQGTANFNQGHSQAGFPRGTRKAKDDHSRITTEDVRPGLLRMMRGSDRPENIAALCVAVNMDNGWRNASVAFTNMIERPDEIADESLLQQITAGMQNAVDLAAHMSARRAERQNPIVRMIRQLVEVGA